MKPKIRHKEAMEFSFKAREAALNGDLSAATDFYSKAAEIESEVAEFYFDKDDLEPTRSILIRSAAFLNIKAGQINEAEKFIFFGLLNIKDETIKEQLNEALEIVMLLKSTSDINDYNYLSELRSQSLHYIIEPKNNKFGDSVSLKMISDFTSNYLKSIKAYAASKLEKLLESGVLTEKTIRAEINKLVNPLVTNTSYGSFKFSIANDYLKREDDLKETAELKKVIIPGFHKEIFTNPLSDEDIDKIKDQYSVDEINSIFKPLASIRANKSAFKVSYYDLDEFKKREVSQIINHQRKRLITKISVEPEEIGELESLLTHRVSLSDGKTRRTTIKKQELKKLEFNESIKEINAEGYSPIILTEEIVLDMYFDSEIGFTVSFEDIDVESTEDNYKSALDNFHNKFYNKILYLINIKEPTLIEQKEIKTIENLVGDTNALKKDKK